MASTWKPRPYCVQPRDAGESCETCSLVNYGRDCRNRPISELAGEKSGKTEPGELGSGTLGTRGEQG